MQNDVALKRIHSLPIWQGEIAIKPLGGGRTNLNFTVSDEIKTSVVRFGGDFPEHLLLRSNELAASRAAHKAGLSPAVLYAENDMAVIEFIKSKTLTEADVQEADMLARIIPLVHKCHMEMPKHFRGPAMMLWVFQSIRHYAATMTEMHSAYAAKLPEYLSICQELEQASGPFDIVFGHNDLMAANFLDDGARLWLIDWDYAGFNSPLFDLGGLASNNSLNETQENLMLELYFDGPVLAETKHRYLAMKCASLLRECMWSMVSELTSTLSDIDFAAYTAENLTRFDKSYQDFKQN